MVSNSLSGRDRQKHEWDFIFDIWFIENIYMMMLHDVSNDHNLYEYKRSLSCCGAGWIDILNFSELICSTMREDALATAIPHKWFHSKFLPNCKRRIAILLVANLKLFTCIDMTCILIHKLCHDEISGPLHLPRRLFWDKFKSNIIF